MSLFLLGTDAHFTGDESGMQWEGYIFELQTAVEWTAVMSRGADAHTDGFDWQIKNWWTGARPGSHRVPNSNNVRDRQE